MILSADRLAGLVESAWRFLFGTNLERRKTPLSPEELKDTLCSGVDLTGRWDRQVVLDISNVLLRRGAGHLFGLPRETVSEDLAADAARELANLVGGQIKTLLHGPCELSLPVLIDAGHRAGLGPVDQRLFFQYDGKALRVTLHKKPSGGA